MVNENTKYCYYVVGIPARAPFTHAMLIMQFLNSSGIYNKSDFRVHYDKSDDAESNVIALFDCKKTRCSSEQLSVFVRNYKGTLIAIEFKRESLTVYREFCCTGLPSIDIDITRETAPNLDLVDQMGRELLYPTFNLIGYAFGSNHPWLAKILRWLSS